MSSKWREVRDWYCRDGTPDEDHDWVLVPGDRSVGEGDYMECAQCGKQREATDSEISTSYEDPE